MKEMVGGCCVCSDERGWPENPLVYCDGQNCTVAVHQACYGIVNVPTGPWYCRKCESQERSARVRCELCPSRDGALKKTDNQGWAHVVCALYIPEVRFGNVTTMEPILLELIPPERYAKTCYICQEIGKGNRANVGACMQCNKSGCKQQFHVTCAQSLGLLCEEAGNYLDNVKYCGYCQHHYSKLVQSKKGGNVKTIPPYKPITHETGSSDSQSSPEKELEPPVSASTSNVSTTLKISSNQNLNTSTTSTSSTSSSSSSKQRKSSSTSKLASSSSSSTSNTAGSGSGSGSGVNAASSSSSTSSSSKNSSSSSSSSKDKEKHSKSLSKISSSSKCQDKESTSSSSSSSTRDKSKSSKSSKDSGDHSSMSSISIGSNNPMINVSSSLSSTMSSASKETIGQKFTTSNFTESVVVNSESVFGANDPPPTSSSSSKTSSSSSSAAKKRKADTIKLSGSTDPVEINKDIIKDVSVTLIPLPIDKPESMDIDKLTSKKPKTESNSSPMHLTHEPNLQNVSPNLMNSQGSSGSITIKQSAPTSSQQAGASNNSSSSHIKGPMLKEESRLRSSPSYNSTTAGLSGSNPSTPSLYVSVPLSTATVPGVNLPSTTSNASDLVTQSQSSRSSPLVSQHHSHHHSSGGIGSNQHQSGIERQSPRIHQSQGLSAPSSLLSDHNTSSCSSQSSTIGAISQANTSPSVGTAAAVGPGSTASPMDTGTLKITYEKQNMRISQLQEQEQAPARRSRSQSGDSSSKSRSGKKRSAANVVVSSTSSSSSSSSSSSTSSTVLGGASTASAALPIGSNTGKEAATLGMNQASTSKSQPSRHNDGQHTVTNSSAPTESSNINNNNNNNNNGSSGNSNTGSVYAASVNTNDLAILAAPASTTSHLNNVNVKQLNKKMLRAQQLHYPNQQQNPPPPPQQQLQPPLQTQAPPPPPAPMLQQQQPPPQQQQPQPQTSTTTQNTTNDEIPPNSTTSSNSRTPDSGNFSSTNSSINSTSLNNGGLKFTYESQIGNNVPSISPSVDTSQPPVVKESPPSSPGSEAGSARKRSRKSVELKDIKVFHNGVHATHMLGNQLNPASSVAQKMSDQLHMEIQDHSVYTQSAVDAGPQVVGVPFPGKHSGVRNQSQPSAGANSLTSMLGGTGSSGSSGNTPQSLEQLLERQWEQGSQFLMEQAQHFDIASLLSCLHQLQNENGRLEDHVKNLKARRDHLLAVNARLAIPLTTNAGQGQATLNNMHMNGPTTDASSARLPRANAHYNAQQQMPMENGIDFRHTSHQSTTTSTTIRHSSTHSNFSSSTSSTHSHHSVLSSSSNRQHQQSISGSSSVSSQQSQPEQLLRSRGSSLSNQSNSSGNNLGPGGGGGVSGSGGGGGGGTGAGGVGGGGSGSAYHSSTQQSAYSTVHQSQLRRDDSQGKPS